MYNLGVLHQQGSGLPQDYRVARQWYERAAALGEALAMHNLGVLYENGSGVGKDLTKARQWYEKAALLGNAAAKEHLASLPRARR
jgi:TPR repeat protein